MALPRTQTSGPAFMAVVYITIGALMDVWSGLWYYFLRRHQSGSDNSYFWCSGFFFTGLALVVIGLALGRIGRQARRAESPPEAPQQNAPSAPAPPVAAMPSFPVQPNAAPTNPSPPTAQPLVANPSSYQPR